MKKLLVVLLIAIAMCGSAFAQITPIHDIQFSEAANGDSPLVGQVVTISGIITAESYAFGGSQYYVQDAEGAWNGVMVYDSANKAAEGDSVTLTGTVTEYKNLTEITTVTSFTIEKEGVFGIEPSLISTVELTEAYEGCLVRVENLTITNPALGFGEWQVDDGSGPCVIDNLGTYYFNPANNTEVASITGVVYFDYSFYKIRPRLAFDIVDAVFTRIQRIQQVRYSDLLKTPLDLKSDTSYLDGDTLTIKGVVTMPTGLSYAGAGVKFIVADPNGGPWSAILSYNADSSAYPQLLEGDLISMTGYIGEYRTSPSNMTEFWITSPINILDFDQPLPEPDSVATGALRWPTTAEQWGNVIVRVGNAVVDNVSPQYELFSVNDGTGRVLVDDDSDSLINFEDPPLGTIAESISGWVYHHYGSYADSTAYKLEPLYTSDIIWGQAPPALKNTKRSLAYPSSSDEIVVTTKISSNLAIASSILYYKVDDGEYTQVAMTDNGDGTFSGTIPAQAEGSYVSYYLKAADVNNQETTDPAVPANLNYSYLVKNSDLTIADLQYTTWKMPDSPFNGYKVAVSGFVTSGDPYLSIFKAFSIQDVSGAWNGIYVFDATGNAVDLPALTIGDFVTVYGTVSDYNSDYHYKWDNNTQILADSVIIVTNNSGTAMPVPTLCATGDLADASPAAEQYEGVLTRVENVTVTSINPYDFSVSDGSGECRIDDDGVGDDVLNIVGNTLAVINGTDTLRVGDVVSSLQGVFTYSFGTFKVAVRNISDIGGYETGVNSGITATPLTYSLGDNFPNPFNPETRIYFTLPQSENTKIIIYNVMGQKIRTLVDQQYQMGSHVVNWDGLTSSGIRAASGVYFYRIIAGDFVATKKMMMLK